MGAKLKRASASLVVAVVSTLLALAAGELVVRSLYKQSTVMFPRYHTDYRYGAYTLRGIRPRAHFRHSSVDGSWEFVTNSRGLRDRREFAYAKPPGTLRVLSLGDSHTQGYEVRQDATYSAVLERALAARGVRAEVLNAGVSGFSTAEALAFLENEGIRYHPDVVVLGFYANDFEDNLKAGLFALEQGALVERRHEHIPGVRLQNLIYAVPGVQWLSENSYLYSFAFNQIWMQAKLRLSQRSAAHAAAGEPAGAAGRFEYALATAAEHSAQQVELAMALLERMQRYCRSHGVRLIVVDIPRPARPYRAAASIPAPAAKRLAEAGIELVRSGALLAESDGAVEMHLPAGHRHISEFTHSAIGLELGRRIAGPARPRPGSKENNDGL